MAPKGVNPAGWLLVFLALASRPVAAAPPPETNSAAAGALSPLESFKAFLASPPAIEEIVFSEKIPPAAGGRGLDGSFGQSRLFNHYQARWQPNGFVFRQLGGLEDATNRLFYFQFIARYDDHHWMVDRRPVLDLWVDDPADTSFTNNFILSTTEFRTRLLREAMLFGIMHLQIGDLKWEGNRFQAVSSLSEFSAAGELFAGANGLPDHLTIQYSDHRRVYHWVARYRYETALGPPFLPSRITCFWIGSRGEGEVEQSEYLIRKLITRDSPMPRPMFDPEPYAQENLWERRRFKNGAIYSILPTGELRLIQVVPTPGKLAVLLPSESRWPIFPVWVTANIGISLLGWRMWNLEKKTKKTTKNSNP